jgi:hypothetical protein
VRSRSIVARMKSEPFSAQYPRIDLRRVSDHWKTFGARVSPLTGSPRLAVNLPNAILNYVYAILESEARLAAAELRLDPGLGVLHQDTSNRDSPARDLMEPVRPLVDTYLFDWTNRGPLPREWFFEQANGNCRLMGSVCSAAFRDGRGMAQSSFRSKRLRLSGKTDRRSLGLHSFQLG